MPAAKQPSQVDDAHAFGALVRRLRKGRGFSLKQVGDAVGFSFQHVSNIELGKSGPPADEIIVRFAEALDADVVDLMNAAGRSLDRNLFERRVLEALERLVKEQRAGFERLDAAIEKLARD